jgi:hypothetical protein
MAIDFNHTILKARDSKGSAIFLAEMLGLPRRQSAGGRFRSSPPKTEPTSTIWILTRNLRRSTTPF